MPYMSLNTQFPGGLTNAAPHQTMSESGVPDPSWSQLYHNDFNTYVAADVTLAGQGAPAAALSTAVGPGGVLLLTSTTVNGDAASIQQPVGSFQLTPNKHQFFKTRLQVANAFSGTVFAGLAANNANPAAAADGLFFFKAANQYGLVLRSVVGGVTTDTALPATCVMANGTMVELGFHVDLQGNVEVFFNPTTGNNLPASGSQRGRVAAAVGLNLTQALLAVTAGASTASAGVAAQLSVDYLTASAER